MATKHPDSAPRLGGVLISNQVVAELLEQLRNGIWQDIDHLPPELLLSWTSEQLDYMHDVPYWRRMVSQCRGAEVLEVGEMQSNDEVWADWLRQENEYAVSDRKSMEAGAGKYLNFIKIVLRRR